MTIRFKKAEQEDSSFLLTLRKASMDIHLTRAGIVLTDDQHLARINEFFEDSNIIYLNEEKIGLIKLGAFKERIHIRQFQLMPEFHNRGIGSKVLNVVIKKAKERRVSITLSVLIDNPAFKLYQRNGFKVEHETELEYQMRWVYQE